MRPTKTFDSIMRRAAALVLTLGTGWPAGSFAVEPDAQAPNAADEKAIDWSALDWNPATLSLPAPKSWSAPGADTINSANWDRKDNPDGTAALSVKRSLPTTWDTKVGVDLGLAPPPSTNLRSLPADRLLTGSQDRSTGVAWANMSVPGISLDARVDPQQDQSIVGTTLSKSLPIGRAFSVTVQNGYSVTKMLANPANPALAAPGLVALPQGSPALPAPSQFYSTDRTAKVDILPTGTTFSAGEKLSTIDEKWLRTIGAEQKLFGNISITGAVSETTTGIPDKSITAGYKKSW